MSDEAIGEEEIFEEEISREELIKEHLSEIDAACQAAQNVRITVYYSLPVRIEPCSVSRRHTACLVYLKQFGNLASLDKQFLFKLVYVRILFRRNVCNISRKCDGDGILMFSVAE